MWDFLDKLMNFALPRVRDFRGIPDRGFDGRGNFTLGVKEHTIFPELEIDRVENPKGMNITIVTTANTDKEGKFLLDQLGMLSENRSDICPVHHWKSKPGVSPNSVRVLTIVALSAAERAHFCVNLEFAASVFAGWR